MTTYTPPTGPEARRLLQAAGLGVQEAADVLCVSRRQVSRYLAGEQAMPWPSVYVLQEVAGWGEPAEYWHQRARYWRDR